MLVFRDGRRNVSGAALVRQLVSSIRAAGLHTGQAKPEFLLDALLRCGELECALADSGAADARAIAEITDHLAHLLLGGTCGMQYGQTLQQLSRINFPVTVQSSPPEGFAYYGLHPLKFVDLADSFLSLSQPAAVVGIRSIGTTLSAVVAAAARRRRVPVSRITVRPTGHPFYRKTEFTVADRRWIAKQRSASAQFMVVDEGPGLSGSSFLSVGDALLEAGVARAQITFLCSSLSNTSRLCTRDGPARWAQFRSLAVEHISHMPPQAEIDASGGLWREFLLESKDEWPASWISMERSKFLSADRGCLWKFEGLGRFGSEIRERSLALAAAGFGPPVEEFDQGYVSYELVPGCPARPKDISTEILDRLAQYCAWREKEFTVSDRQAEDLGKMLACNLREEFGEGINDPELGFDVEDVVLADGRMAPHEWILSPNGLIKTDGASHGDDHFYPGPTDIAWDLAGAITEWRMDSRARNYFLQQYRRLSGCDPQARLPAFLRAYSAFRMGYCKMAAEALRGSIEEVRLTREYLYHRDRVAQAAGVGLAA